MELVFEKSFDHREEADLLVIPCWKREGHVETACKCPEYQEKIDPVTDLGDFRGHDKEVCLLYDWAQKEPRILLLGLGQEDKATLETLRRAYAEALKVAMSKKLKTVNLLLPSHAEYSSHQVVYAIAEAAALTNYSFDYMSSKQEKKPLLLEKISLIVEGCDAKEVLREVKAITQGVRLAKDLVNGNADAITPRVLADEAEKLQKTYPEISLLVLDREGIQKQKMGLFYAVARSSPEEPYFIVIQYQGMPGAKDHTVFIGKGITYDTGGLSLKPTASMESMRCDMAGAAVVLGAIKGIAELRLPVNVSGIIAATENAIDATSYKVGDVYTGYNQTTVEIKNTDAEGRLALADCLAYAVDKLQPTRIIDLATLTGAALIALGDYRSPLFSNQEMLAEELFEAGEDVGERLWLMPLDSDYRELITSKIADLKNSGAREGSLIFSAMFLKEFVGQVPWAHVDIAGPAFLDKPRYYHTTQATGYGVRLLIHYLKKFHVQGT